MKPRVSRRNFLKLSVATTLGLVLSACRIELTEEPMTTIGNNSPFAIYSPYGEFRHDKNTFASQEDIFGYIRDIGAKWVQELPPFLAIDIVPDEFYLYSRVGREAGMVPALIRVPDAVKRFKEELTQTLTSGVDKFKYLEVDTEPDGLGGWQNDPEGYVELLRLSHESIKKISPSCQIMFGGLSGGQAILDNQGTIFLEKTLAAGAADYIDGLAFKRHHLSVQTYAEMKNQFETIGGILAKYGLDIHKMPIFLETAMYDGDPNDPAPHPFIPNLPIQTETEQASGLIKSYIYAITLGVDKIFWNLVFERNDFEPGHLNPFPQTPFNHYGLINNPINVDGHSHKKLAYYSYKKMVELLEGSDWSGVITIQDSENVFICKFENQGNTIFVAWWDYYQKPAYQPGETKKVLLSNLKGSSARIIETVPNVPSGDLVLDYSNAFTEKIQIIEAGEISLQLGELPLFIEL